MIFIRFSYRNREANRKKIQIPRNMWLFWKTNDCFDTMQTLQRPIQGNFGLVENQYVKKFEGKIENRRETKSGWGKMFTVFQ